MKKLRLIIIMLTVVVLFASCADNNQSVITNMTLWSGAGRDSLRTAHADGEVLPPFGALWVERIDGLGISSVSVAKVTIDDEIKQVAFASGSEKSVVAVEADTGKLLWDVRFATRPHAPVYSDGKLVFITDDGAIQCVYADSGNLIWALKYINDASELSYEVSEPVISGGFVFFCASNGLVIAMNLDDGKEVWRVEMGDRINSSPIVVDGKLIVADYSNNISAYKAHSGEEVWTQMTSQPVIAPLCSNGDSVFVSGAFGAVSAVKISDGEINWDKDIGGSIVHSSCIDDNHLYVPTQNMKVVKLNIDTGEVDGEFETEAISSGLVCTNNYLLFTTESGKLQIIELDSGVVEIGYEFATWEPGIDRQSFGDLAVVSGRVFVSDGQNKFFCLVPKEIAMKTHEVGLPDTNTETEDESISNRDITP